MRLKSYLLALVNPPKQLHKYSLGFLIQSLSRRIDSAMRDSLVDVDLDVKLFANLMVLAQKDGINQRALGKELDFPDYFTSRNVDSLVGAGYVERRPDPNSRRSSLIYLTEAGREKVKHLPEIIMEVNQGFMSPLDEEEKKQLIHLLQKVARIEFD